MDNRLSRLLAALFALGLLSACVPAPQPRLIGPPAVAGTCGALAMQSLVGQPARVLAAMTFPAGTRILRPGDAVTEDYGPSRLNIEIDLHEIISGVHCG